MLEGASQTDAYLKAYPRCKWPRVNASIMANKPWFQEELDRRRQAAAYQTDITQERIYSEEKAIAFFDPAELYKESSRMFGGGPRFELKEIPELPPEIRRAIMGFKQKTMLDGSIQVELKFWDKGKSLERLAKYIGMLKDENIFLNFEFIQLVMRLIPDERVTELKQLLRESLAAKGSAPTR